MTTSPRFDRIAVLQGAAVAGGGALVFGLIGRSMPSAAGLLTLLIFVAMVGGGYVAARPQPTVALSSGGIAALLGAAATQLLNVAYALARGTFSTGDVIVVVAVLLLSTSLGTIGGYVAFRRDARERSEAELEA